MGLRSLKLRAYYQALKQGLTAAVDDEAELESDRRWLFAGRDDLATVDPMRQPPKMP